MPFVRIAIASLTADNQSETVIIIIVVSSHPLVNAKLQNAKPPDRGHRRERSRRDETSMATMTPRCELTPTPTRAAATRSSGGTRNLMRQRPRVSQQRATNRRGVVVVRAEASKEEEAKDKPAVKGPRAVRRRSASGGVANGGEDDEALARLVVRVATRYDWFSAGVGASSCAMWFVIQGQSVSTALGIASVATIAAVVVEELLGDCERGW